MTADETIPQKRRRLRLYHILIILALIGAGAFTTFRRSLRARLRARIDAIRAAGYPVTCAELDRWYTIPPDAENAAYTIMDAFSYYKKWDKMKAEALPLVSQAELPARTEAMAEETKLLVAQYINDNNEAIELLRAGAAIEHCRYPIDLNAFFDALLPHLSELRVGVQMLNLEAVLHAENGNSDSAIRALQSAFGIARSLEKEPLIVSHLVRVACQSLTLSALERIVNRIEFTDSQLTELGHVPAFAEEHSSHFARAFICERCMGLAFFNMPSSKILQFIATHSSRSSKSHLEANLQILALDLRRFTGLNDRSGILYLDFMKEFIKANRLAFEGRGEAVETIINGKLESTLKRDPFLRMVIPGLSRLGVSNLRAMAHVRTARTAIAIQRYRLAKGKLPESLSDLVPAYLEAVPMDPFDGRELRYEKPGVGFVVYSIDKDLHDDGGVEEPSPKRKKAGAQNWDVTFIVER